MLEREEPDLDGEGEESVWADGRKERVNERESQHKFQSHLFSWDKFVGFGRWNNI